MPVTVGKREDKWCIIEPDGGVGPCHDTEEAAMAQMRAINANKDADAAGTDEEKGFHFVPFSATSFEEIDAAEEAAEIVESIHELTRNYQSLTWNILEGAEVGDPVAAIKQLSGAYADRLAALLNERKGHSNPTPKSPFNKFIALLKDALGMSGEPEEEIKSGSESDNMLIWKDKGGTYRWVASYSNKYRDEDRPSEIISSESHRQFTKMVSQGAAPQPELWFWHEPKWKFGQSDWVAYDDAGFAVAGGRIDDNPAAIELAKCISQIDDIRVSHGMPRWSIRRDSNDKSIITSHVTREISPLPGWAAANPLTGFVVIDDDVTRRNKNMALSEQDKQRLINDEGVPADVLARLEEFNSSRAKAAEAAGVQSKEKELEIPAVGEPDAQKGEGVEPTGNVEGKDEKPPEASAASEDDVKQLAGLVTILAERVNALTKSVGELKEADDDRIAKQAEVTPLASVMGLLQRSVIGDPATKVDGRSTLAKDAPKEAPTPAARKTGIPFVDNMLVPRESA